MFGRDSARSLGEIREIGSARERASRYRFFLPTPAALGRLVRSTPESRGELKH
jgi:hypothetical protein